MNPITFFVIIAVINVLIKSANDKKKIEEARRKRAEQMKDKPAPNRAKDIGARINKEIEEGLRKKGILVTESSTKVEATEKKEIKRLIVEDPSVTEDLKIVRKEKDVKKESISTSSDDRQFDKKKELLKGIIYSEILSEPKAIQNLKKSV